MSPRLIKLILLTFYLILFIFIILKVNTSIINKQNTGLVSAGPSTILYTGIEEIRGPDIPDISVEIIGNSNDITSIISQILDHVRNLQDQNIKDLLIINEQSRILYEYIGEKDKRKIYYKKLLEENLENKNEFIFEKTKSIQSFIEQLEKIKKGSSIHDKTLILKNYGKLLKYNAEFQHSIKQIFRVLNEESYNYEIFLSKIKEKVRNVDIFLKDIVDKIQQKDISNDKKNKALETIEALKKHLEKYINNDNILSIASNDTTVTLNAIDSVIESVQANALEFLQME